MTDIRANQGKPLDEEDRLPWLEAVEEDDDKGGPTAGKMIAFVVIGLVAIGLIVGGLFWMGNRATDGGIAGSGEPELIAAPEGDYKVKPGDPGGMKVQGEGDQAFAASEGVDTKSAINVNAVPERPVTKEAPAPAAEPKETQVAAATPQPKAPAAPAAAAQQPAAGGGATIQLGAFDSSAAANAVWKTMSGRFAYLAPLNQSIMTATVKGKTYYRLRASGPTARDVCRRLEVAGETCLVVS